MSQPAGNCPICEKPLRGEDDVVTCPSCGAPYHRACYQQQGQCSFAEKHGTGFEYKPPQPEPAAGSAAQPAKNQGGVLCAHCNTVNDAANIFCESCGQPLHTRPGQATGSFGGAGRPNAAPPPQGGMPFGGPQMGWGYGPQMRYTGDIEGIPASEWAEFIGSSAPVYLARLHTMERGKRKISFMFSAFIFSPTYFAYRKMWGWAAISLAATLFLMIPQLLMIAASQGIALPFAISLSTLELLANVFYYIDVVMRVLFGMFALFLFRGFAVKKIGQIRQEADGDMEYHNQLIRRGGVSVPGVLVVIAVLMGVGMLAYFWMGDAVLAYLYPELFI